MEREYVLGTHDEEILRLGLQHRVWRPLVTDAWARAGIAPGQTVLDVGCGPGYATMDLARMVGLAGRVVAVDQSRRFLDYLVERVRGDAIANVEVVPRDLSTDTLPPLAADAAWCRWIFAFVRDPRGLLDQVAGALRPGGSIVIHEYFDYRLWRLLPPCDELETFVDLVMESWRADGGEPDIGARLPAWLEELGFSLQSTRRLGYILQPSDEMWQWPAAFVRTGLRRLVGLGRLTEAGAHTLLAGIETCERRPGVRVATPGVLEIVARRPL